MTADPDYDLTEDQQLLASQIKLDSEQRKPPYLGEIQKLLKNGMNGISEFQILDQKLKILKSSGQNVCWFFQDEVDDKFLPFSQVSYQQELAEISRLKAVATGAEVQEERVFADVLGFKPSAQKPKYDDSEPYYHITMWKSEEEKDFEKKFLAEIEGMAEAFEQSMKEAGN